MTVTETTTTGTPNDPSVIGAGDTPSVSTDASGAGGAGDGETAEQLRARVADLESKHKQDLARLSAGEEAARRAQALEDELNRERAARSGWGNQPPATYDPQAARLVEVYQQARATTPETVELLEHTTRAIASQFEEQRREMEKREAKLRYERELDAIPADKRAEVDRRSRAEGLWPSITYDRVLADELRSSRNEIAEQKRRLQEEQDRMKRGVVRTTSEPAPPSSNDKTPTREEYARTARLAAEGNSAARTKMREWDDAEAASGPIKFRDG